MQSDPHIRKWIGCAAFIVVAAACGTATQPGPVGPPKDTLPAIDAQSTAPEPTCPDDQDYIPDAGCSYSADGTPPKVSDAPIRPIPEGTIGEGAEQRHVPSFWMDEHKVLVKDYRACVQAGICSVPDDGSECPWGTAGSDDKAVTCVAWEQARAYCEWTKKRLITDDEWVLAAQKHKAYGLRDMEDSEPEWTGSYYCDESIGGCGHSRVVRGGHKALNRGRNGAVGGAWVGFRCVWSAKPPRAEESPLPKIGVSSTTPGAIACNTVSCDLASQMCCLNITDGVGRCLAKEGAFCRAGDIHAHCDENADCAGGQVCCPYWGCSGGCPPEHICQQAPCDYGNEVCLPGGACRRGFRCVTDETGMAGACQWENIGARCGGKRCSGDTPVCCWNAETKKGECVASSCPSESNRLTCSGPADCGGSACVAYHFIGQPETEPDQGYVCGPLSHVVNSVLCSSMKDCFQHPPTGAPPLRCAHTAELPPGVKKCVYFEGSEGG